VDFVVQHTQCAYRLTGTGGKKKAEKKDVKQTKINTFNKLVQGGSRENLQETRFYPKYRDVF